MNSTDLTTKFDKDNILSWRICRGRNNSKTCDTLVCNNASRDSWLCLKCETELNYYKREGGNDDDNNTIMLSELFRNYHDIKKTQSIYKYVRRLPCYEHSSGKLLVKYRLPDITWKISIPLYTSSWVRKAREITIKQLAIHYRTELFNVEKALTQLIDNLPSFDNKNDDAVYYSYMTWEHIIIPEDDLDAFYEENIHDSFHVKSHKGYIYVCLKSTVDCYDNNITVNVQQEIEIDGYMKDNLRQLIGDNE